MRSRRQPASAMRRRVHVSGERRIVLLDQQPIREAASGEARKIMREIQGLNEALSEFDRTIRPAYERWERKNLAPLLDEERALKAKIERLERLVDMADLESLFSGKDPYDIFEKAAQEDEGEAGHKEEAKAAEDNNDGEFPEEERDFRSYVRFVFGDDPDSLGPNRYRRLFDEYRKWRAKIGEASRSASARKSEDVPARVKEIYRILVRRLHPDTGKSRQDPHTRKLWDDLQAAYAAQDLERLEVLLAITDLHETGGAMRSTVFHLRQVARELGNQLHSLKVRLMQARKTPAWIYWHSKNRRKAGEKIRSDVLKRVEAARKELEAVEAEIEEWKRESAAKKRLEFGKSRAPKRAKRKTASARTEVQNDFDFGEEE
ncbi:MAG: hypothetical protein KGR46_02805 [Verrucomicrobia bacterium]|nr:hypothetical protein [Verrucomicrobiota bacterium]